MNTRAKVRATGLVLATCVGLVGSGCTPHEDGREPTSPLSSGSPGPDALVLEPEPAPTLPGRVAPALPPLRPTRPLANLELRWHHSGDAGPPAETLWTVGTSLVAMPADAAAALGLAGPPDTLGSLAERAWSFRRAGPLVLALSVDEVVALEAGTGKVAWATPGSDDRRSYLRVVDERVMVSSVHRSNGDALEARALDSGRLLWTRGPAAGDQGRQGPGFERIRELASDGVRGYFVSDAGLEVFDPITGSTAWATTLADPRCGFVAAEGWVVVEQPGGYALFDPELGTGRGHLAGPERCGWAGYGTVSGQIAGGRLYAFDDLSGELRAYDLDSQTQLWAAPGFDVSILAADHDAVFVARGGHTLVALDAATGTPALEIGVGAWFGVSIEPVGGDAGPLVLLEDEDAGTLILGRGPQALAPEDWEVRGRLVSDGSLAKKRLAGVALEVGGVALETDARGRFVARGTGRGVLRVDDNLEDSSYDPNTWTTVGIDPERVVLDGRGRYELGELEAYEVSME